MQKAAFFDIDKTLYPGTLAVDFVSIGIKSATEIWQDAIQALFGDC